MPFEILLVEDSPGDVRLTQEAFRHASSTIRLHVASDGVEAMAFLRKEGVYAHAPKPSLILLDLNLPRMDGREVLAQVKGDATLKAIPVVVLTTSDRDDDIATCYGLNVNCYVKKPTHFDAFQTLLHSVSNLWLNGKVPQPLAATG